MPAIIKEKTSLSLRGNQKGAPERMLAKLDNRHDHSVAARRFKL
jgi:hypothetical protein